MVVWIAILKLSGQRSCAITPGWLQKWLDGLGVAHGVRWEKPIKQQWGGWSVSRGAARLDASSLLGV